MQPFILNEIYQIAKPFGYNQTFVIDRPYFAFIRNQADLEDVTLGSTMNASFFTGIFYLFGKVPPYLRSNVQEAIIWFSKAGNQGHAGAQCVLGILYYYGTHDVVARDRNVAMRWFYRAGEWHNSLKKKTQST